MNSNYQIINPTCFGSSNGTIFSNITGGVAPYTYLWNNGKTTPNINLLKADTYTLLVTDSMGSTELFSYVVTQPTVINFIHSVDNGILTLSASGGTPGYRYSVNSGPFTSQDTYNLSEGTYLLKVKDLNNCQKTKLIKI